MNTIQRANPAAERLTHERCQILELQNFPADPACSIAQARVAPHTTTRWHRLSGITERYVILAGSGQVEIGREPATPIGPLDVVHIPPEVPQRITNTGSTDLVFLCVCTPRFVQDAYTDIEPQ
jgi:mannose-6-phosphate isomerase-like protein (cupin superfamily)